MKDWCTELVGILVESFKKVLVAWVIRESYKACWVTGRGTGGVTWGPGRGRDVVKWKIINETRGYLIRNGGRFGMRDRWGSIMD